MNVNAGFNVAADAYDRFMGRYSTLLSPQMAELARIAPGQRVLDVGCGPGALTTVLVERLGADNVAAVDPSEPFVEAARRRLPGVDIRRAPAEDLPFDADSFDASIAQLVVHFMDDPVAGLREMRRVTRPGGIVAACVWDHAGGRGPLGVFWEAARQLDAKAADESRLAGARRDHLGELFEAAGFRAVERSEISAPLRHPSFEEWWEPYTQGVGPAGAHVAGLDAERRAQLRDRCRELLPDPPFTLESIAWTARGRA
jgi:SAM-dependent methyltransferase